MIDTTLISFTHAGTHTQHTFATRSFTFRPSEYVSWCMVRACGDDTFIWIALRISIQKFSFSRWFLLCKDVRNTASKLSNSCAAEKSIHFLRSCIERKTNSIEFYSIETVRPYGIWICFLFLCGWSYSPFDRIVNRDDDYHVWLLLIHFLTMSVSPILYTCWPSLCSGSSIQPTQHTRSHSINISLCSVQSESVLVLRTTENIPKKNQNCISLDVSGSVFVVKKRATLTQKKKKKITHTKSTYNNDKNVPLQYVFCLLLPFVFFSNFVRRLISHIHQVLLLSPFCRWNVLMRTIHFSASPHTHLFERVEW